MKQTFELRCHREEIFDGMAIEPAAWRESDVMLNIESSAVPENLRAVKINGRWFRRSDDAYFKDWPDEMEKMWNEMGAANPGSAAPPIKAVQA